MNGLSIGQVVLSTAGRDMGNKFIVLCIINNQYVYICDGDIRKVEHPKKKKVKHLEGLNYISHNIKEKLESDKTITNNEVKKAIKAIDLYREQEV